ncbi:MAG: alpha/beta hydrolase, partial [Sphingobacteriaceae bacterium]
MNLKIKLITAAMSCCFYAPIFAQQVIPLWQNGAPGFEKLRNEPEQAK